MEKNKKIKKNAHNGPRRGIRVWVCIYLFFVSPQSARCITTLIMYEEIKGEGI